VIILPGMEITWESIGSMSECPKCGGTDIAMILWGLPQMSEDLEKKVKDKKIVFGGCCVSRGDPKLECNDCGWRY
jgi:rubredoxin|tara:strand:+ start:293 stop:517 length:225 start_codon:yes stop_codon:yes gene_type:complete